MDIQKLAENMLWDEISAYVEQVHEFKRMIKDIPYINHDKVNEVKWCEVFESEEIIVLDSKEYDEKINIDFEMPFILSAWNDETQLFRVTACVHGKAELTQEEVIKLEETVYTNVEADSVYRVF